MIEFSCYNGHFHSLTSKMTHHLSDEAIHKALEDGFDNHGLKNMNSCSETPLHLEPQVGGLCITADQAMSSSSIDHDWKSDEIKTDYVAESDDKTHNTCMKRSQSLGSELFRKGRFISDADSGNETAQGFSGDGSHGQSGSLYSFGEKDPEVSTSDQLPGALHSVSVQVSSDLVQNESIFSIGEPQQKVEFPGNSYPQSSAECSKYIPHTPHIPNVISKSFSSSNIVAYGGHAAGKNITARPTSCDDLNDTMPHKLGTKASQDGEGDDSAENNDKTIVDDFPDDCYDGYNYVSTAKDWIMPDEANTPKHRQLETTVHHPSEFPRKDFKIKRIEEWVSNLQHCTPSEEKYDLATPCNYSADYRDNVLKDLPVARQDTKSTPGMESVKRYISSLSATATSAQLANHGLVAIPFLRAFVSLKAVNLSGNDIVRITSGALPRGLHVLNLSKNNISTIEGLRELTRLRVLDLSYNRILRIGHGLASCSSLKELYLAGNKISDVEGLHRLLKLNVLDLRFNKISTTKCLGQLAANYNSLQAISLEGNPAQKNVGDEQLKKHLQGLLPHLVYYNRQSIKFGSLKDSSSTRLASHQFDRSLRSDLKSVRKVNHGVASHRRTPSILHGRRNHQVVASAKPTRDRHGRLPPSGVKTVSRPSFYDFGSRGISFRPEIAMHRSRSVGNLGAL